MHHVPENLRVLQREEAHAIHCQLRRLEVRHDEDPAFADVNELEATEEHFGHGRPGCRLPQHQACAATGLLDGGVHGGAALPFQREVRQARAHARGHAVPWRASGNNKQWTHLLMSSRLDLKTRLLKRPNK